MFRNNFCRGSVITVVLLSCLASAGAETAVSDINAKIAQLDIENAGLDDVVRIFGEPVNYIWGSETFKKDNLPVMYIAGYPNGFSVVIRNGMVVELRHTGPDGYLFRGKLKIGSSLDEVFDVVGRPAKIVEKGPNKFKDGVLYKDIDGTKGNCYYGRKDQGFRCFFTDYKVGAIFTVCRICGGRGGVCKAGKRGPAGNTGVAAKPADAGKPLEPAGRSPVGKWESIDFVKDINNFKPGQKSWQGELFLKGVEFMPDGTTSLPDTWKEGFIYAGDGKIKAKFEIREINGTAYLFFPRLSSETAARGQEPLYYVLKKSSVSKP
jgi:hypothetical protein